MREPFYAIEVEHRKALGAPLGSEAEPPAAPGRAPGGAPGDEMVTAVFKWKRNRLFDRPAAVLAERWARDGREMAERWARDG